MSKILSAQERGVARDRDKWLQELDAIREYYARCMANAIICGGFKEIKGVLTQFEHAVRSHDAKEPK